MNAAIYCRISSEKQEDNSSLASQEASCRAYAAEKGYAVAQVYQEVYTGAALWERPQLTTLRDRVRAGEIQVVIAHAVDRLSRNQAHLFILVDEWERHGATPAFVTEDLDQSPIGKVILSLKGFAAEVEREKIQERTMRGLRSRMAAGKLKPGSRPLYGYRWPIEAREIDGEMTTIVVRDRHEIDPQTAPIVRRIFREYAEGRSLKSIAERLESDGIPTAAGTTVWRRATVLNVLRHPSYKGETYANRFATIRERGKEKQIERPRDEWVRLPDGTTPPIVSEEEWDAARARIARNVAESTRRNSSPESFLLRGGYLLCGHCGQPAYANVTKDRQGRVVQRYIVHSSKEQHRDCPNLAMVAALLDAAAEDYLKQVGLNADVLAWELQRLGEAGEHTDADRRAVESRIGEVKRKQRILGASVEALNDPEAAEPLLDRLRALAAERRTLEQEREGLATRAADHAAMIARLRDVKDQAVELADKFHLLPYRTKRDLVAAINLTARIYPAGAPDRYVFESDAEGLLRAIGFPSGAREAIAGCASSSRRGADS